MTPRQTVIGGTIVFLTFLGLSLARLGDFALDETGSHYPAMLSYFNGGIQSVFSPTYSTANTPLPYLLTGTVARIAGPSLALARTVTCIVSFLAFLVVLRLLALDDAPPYLSFVVLFYPYIFLNSFLLYAGNYGLLFTLLALVTLRSSEQRPSYPRDLLAGILMALAVLCQQFYLVIPLALLLSRFAAAYSQGRTPGAALNRKMIISASLLIGPLIVPALLFLAWGGLAHPNYQERWLGIYPSTAVAVLTVTGFYGAPILFQERRRLRRGVVALALIVSAVLTVAFKPAFTDRYEPGAFAGMTHHIIDLTARIHPFIPFLLTLGLTMSGVLVVITLWKTLSRPWHHFLYASCMLLAVAYSFVTYIGERHLLGYIVFLFLLMIPHLRRPLLWAYPMGMAALGIAYYFWWFFFKWGTV